MKIIYSITGRNLKSGFIGKILIILSFSGIILLSGCSRYQYISINSNLARNENKEFVYENDTANIRYSFSGENLPVTIKIYNKLRQPVYIDLARSTVIINNSQINNSFYRDGQPSYIPPLSYVTIISNPLRRKQFDISARDSSTNVYLGPPSEVIHSFNEEASPLHFRSILALTTFEDFSNPTFFDYSFWVSDIQQTFTGPVPSNLRPSNQFYIREATAMGKIFKWTGIIGALILLSAAAPAQ